MDPYEPFQSEMTATRVTFEAKNVPLNPLRNGDFRLKKTLSSYVLDPLSTWQVPPPQKWGFWAKKDPLKRMFRTH